MLTGPVTILNWSFVRDDIPRSEACRQIALAIRDEVADLEAAGAGMIQIDEAALREGLPLEPLHAQIVNVIELHPEYHAVVESDAEALARDYTPEGSTTNPTRNDATPRASPCSTV